MSAANLPKITEAEFCQFADNYETLEDAVSSMVNIGLYPATNNRWILAPFVGEGSEIREIGWVGEIVCKSADLPTEIERLKRLIVIGVKDDCERYA